MKAKVLTLFEDGLFATLLARSLERRGAQVRRAATMAELLADAGRLHFDFAVLELEGAGRTILALVPRLKAINPACRIVLLCDPLGVKMAAKAVRVGACDVVLKPVDSARLAEVVMSAVPPSIRRQTAAPSRPAPDSAAVLAALQRHGWNYSAAARELQIARRTVQRRIEREPLRFKRPD